MYIIDDKNLDFYHKILHALDGRESCTPASAINVDEV